MLMQAFLGALVYTILGLTTSIYVQKIVDFVLVEGNTRLLNLLSVGMCLLLTLQVVILLFEERVCFKDRAANRY
jgi:ATP-binding cassette subfamily B protein